MNTIILHKPELRELAFRRSLLEDPETMAFNRAWGGTIPFPEERWADWYRRWVEVPDRRFYRLLLDRTAGKFVGEVSFHWDGELGEYLCDVLIAAAFRGRGYGRQGLELLCGAAGASGVKTLCDNIALDNPSVRLFLRSGFRERYRNETFILVVKEL